MSVHIFNLIEWPVDKNLKGKYKNIFKKKILFEKREVTQLKVCKINEDIHIKIYILHKGDKR